MTTSATPGFCCCSGSAWTLAADLGHAEAIDFTLGRCSVCGRYWMHLWTAFSHGEGYAAVDDAVARELLEMQPGPDRKRRLSELFNS